MPAYPAICAAKLAMKPNSASKENTFAKPTMFNFLSNARVKRARYERRI